MLQVAPTDYMQLRNRVNVAASRARYHLTVLASESAQFSMKSRLGREASLWGAVFDTPVADGSGAPVFVGGGDVGFGTGPLHAAQVRPCPLCWLAALCVVVGGIVKRVLRSGRGLEMHFCCCRRVCCAALCCVCDSAGSLIVL